MAVQTPASRIPSHGTDMLGQRYAFDLIRFDPRKGSRTTPPVAYGRCSSASPRVSAMAGASRSTPRSTGRWWRPATGSEERSRIHPIRELALVLKNGLTFRPTPEHLHRVMGNHVILRCGDVYAGFAHLTTGSVAVQAGQQVRVGDVLGRVGHTGNSSAPHLHFQLMDGPDALTAHGIPCAFREYEVWRDGGWQRVEHAIPTSTDQIRSVSG